MSLLLQMIGMAILLFGIAIVLKPDFALQLMEFMKQGKRLYAAGILRILIGICLLLVAAQSRLVTLTLALGILFILAGVLIFLLGLDKVTSIVDYWAKRSQAVIRLTGLVALIFGGLIIYSL